MELTIYLEQNQTTQKINASLSTVLDLLNHLKINPETVLVTRNNTVLTEDIELNNNDKLEILSVISGG